MLDQNIALLLSTLLGGLLTIVGGFAANIYLQRASQNADRQRESRLLLENAYQQLLKINDLYTRLDFQHSRENSVDEIVLDIRGEMNKLRPMIYFHLSLLEKEFDAFNVAVKNYNDLMFGNKQPKDEEFFRRRDELINQMQSKGEKLADAIIALLKQKQYNYF
jgi:hypothetical protein